QMRLLPVAQVQELRAHHRTQASTQRALLRSTESDAALCNRDVLQEEANGLPCSSGTDLFVGAVTVVRVVQLCCRYRDSWPERSDEGFLPGDRQEALELL